MRRPLSIALPLIAAACSFTNLDGFTGGTKSGPDGGGQSDSGGASSGGTDGGPGADATTNGEGGPTSTDPYGDAVRADAPASWWRCEDTEGSATLEDAMGLHHADVLPREGKPLAIQWGVPGVVGKAAQLGNSAGFFRVGDFFDFAGQAEFALEVWAQNDAPAAEYEGIFNKRIDNDTGADTGWILYLHKPDRDLGFQFWKNASITAGTTGMLATGFHHVVLSATKRVDGVDYVFYIDGHEGDHDGKNTVEEADTSAQLVMGYGWNGALDEIAIYEHPLSADRVMAHYKAARP